jgi:integrase/recombinase XerD
MRSQRGVTDSTLDIYQTTLVDLLKALGDDSKAFTAHAVPTFARQAALPRRGQEKGGAVDIQGCRPGRAPPCGHG